MPRRSPATPRRSIEVAAAVALAAASFALAGCRRRHIPVTESPELGYPACPRAASSASTEARAQDAGVDDDPGVVVGSGHIRSGPYSSEPDVVERFELRRTSCGFTFRSRQEWPREASDIEVRYDADLRPLWAWKRRTIPGSPRADGAAELRRYELRTGEVFIKRRDAAGDDRARAPLAGRSPEAGGRRARRGGHRSGTRRPHAVAAAGEARRGGQGVRTRARLSERRRDARSRVARAQRRPRRAHPRGQARARVHVLRVGDGLRGRDDVVIGDLAGMRPSDSLSTPEPDSLPTYGEPESARCLLTFPIPGWSCAPARGRRCRSPRKPPGGANPRRAIFSDSMASSDAARIREVQFDGLVGPTHNYAGLSPGNLASAANEGQVANPRRAAHEGLAKMRFVRDLGVPQAVLPPHDRPSLAALRRLGFAGSDEEVIAAAAAGDGCSSACCSSASAMWTANAATVAPSRRHRRTAGCTSRRPTCSRCSTGRSRRRRRPASSAPIFADTARFVVHDALSGGGQLADEGAANHTRLCTSRGALQCSHGAGAPGDGAAAPTRYPARQTREASEAVARLHALDPARCLFPQQHPPGSTRGAFHTDVLAVGHGRVLHVPRAARSPTPRRGSSNARCGRAR